MDFRPSQIKALLISTTVILLLTSCGDKVPTNPNTQEPYRESSRGMAPRSIAGVDLPTWKNRTSIRKLWRPLTTTEKQEFWHHHLTNIVYEEASGAIHHFRQFVFVTPTQQTDEEGSGGPGDKAPYKGTSYPKIDREEELDELPETDPTFSLKYYKRRGGTIINILKYDYTMVEMYQKQGLTAIYAESENEDYPQRYLILDPEHRFLVDITAVGNEKYSR
jgi:hypothetical protein